MIVLLLEKKLRQKKIDSNDIKQDVVNEIMNILDTMHKDIEKERI